MGTYIGRVFENLSSEEFSFVSTDFFSGGFVQVAWNGLLGVCRVTEKKAVNRRFTDPAIIHYIDKTEVLDKDVTYVCSARLIRVLDGRGNAADALIPFAPGSVVLAADDDKISAAYGIQAEGICMGHLPSLPSCRVLLPPERIFNPHMIVLGKTGSGKSYFAKRLMKALEGYTRIIFSPTDEYDDAALLPGGETAPVVRAEDIVFPFSIEWLSKFWNLTYTEEKALAQVAFDEKKVYHAKEAVAEIETFFLRRAQEGEAQMRIAGMDGLAEGRVQDLPNHVQGLIAKIRKRPLRFSLDPGAVTELRDTCVVDMSACAPWLPECVLAYHIDRILERQRRTQKEKRKKTVILLEEAHNYVPSVRNPLCKESIVRLAREGRKYGISLCMITQRPRNFDQTALSQSGNKFLFSMSHPDDIRSVLEDAYYYSRELTGQIQRLEVGECVINGDAVRDAFQFKVKFG